jgi:hypothetical protein
MTVEGILPSASDTLLTISGFGTLLYQARNLDQTLEVIQEASDMERSVNGTLVDLSNPIFRKYKSKISCTDVNAPPLDNIWPGMVVTVGCTINLCYPVSNPGSPARNEVSGSSYTQGHFVFYRPVLIMRVAQLSQNFEEWKANNGWTLTLEEI